MNFPELTTDDKLTHLRELLEHSAGYDAQLIRPHVPTHLKSFPKAMVYCHGEGPLTVVTFYISHLPDEERAKEMEAKAIAAGL